MPEIIETEEIPFESQTAENKDGYTGLSFREGRTPIEIDYAVHKKKAKKWDRSSDALSAESAPDRRSRNEGGKKVSSDSLDMLNLTTPVTPSKVRSEVAWLFLKLKTKEKESIQFSLSQTEDPGTVSVDFRIILERRCLKVLLYNRKENYLKPGTKESWLSCFIASSCLGFWAEES